MQFIWSCFPLFLTCMKVAGCQANRSQGKTLALMKIMLEKLTLRAEPLRYIHTMCLRTPPPQDCKSVKSVLMFGGGP